ncbi:unnamed protein product [Arctia plantaginis]|uniref:Uncharacterized protein n=1 Tax=Arctia plantaginis TaxID=874455 RepID=A0A8S1AAT1_ARCPL|nr:unnamed protein product [Arctia plantaginis]CAB3249055.1 unnamed protein product [Arctia plantaginis]
MRKLKGEQRRTEICNRHVARPVPSSAIAWPYRWLFALTECGEQRSPAAWWCARVRTGGAHCRAHAHSPTCTDVWQELDARSPKSI